MQFHLYEVPVERKMGTSRDEEEAKRESLFYRDRAIGGDDESWQWDSALYNRVNAFNTADLETYELVRPNYYVSILPWLVIRKVGRECGHYEHRWIKSMK